MLDTINGLYELLGGLFILATCYRLYRDQESRGISLLHVGFFVTWGYFNLAFYPAVGARLSACGAIGVALANTLWLAMIVYYRRKAC